MLLIGCSSNVIDEDDLIEKASLKYLNNNDEPYTGAISANLKMVKIKLLVNIKRGKEQASGHFFMIAVPKKKKETIWMGAWRVSGYLIQKMV